MSGYTGAIATAVAIILLMVIALLVVSPPEPWLACQEDEVWTWLGDFPDRVSWGCTNIEVLEFRHFTDTR